MLKESIELHRTGRLEEAERGYRAYLSENANDAEALHLLGLLRQQTNDSAEAVALLTRAHELAPDRPKILLTLGAIYFQQNNFALASDVYQRALVLDPNLPGAHAALGHLALVRGEVDLAEQYFRTALRVAEDPQALAGLGAIALGRDDSDNALRHLTRAVDLAPDDAAIHFTLGRAFMAREALAFAEQTFGNALRLRPDFYAVRPLLGQLLIRNGRVTEAEPHFRVLQDIPGFELAFELGMADVTRAQGRLEEAIQHYSNALQRDPRQPLAVQAHAWCLAQLGRGAEALTCYDEYLKQAPDDLAVLAAKADFFMLFGRLKEATEVWQTVYKIQPDDIRAQMRLAILHERFGEWDVALKYAGNVMQRLPDDAEMALISVRARLRNGDPKGARDLLAALAQQSLSEGQTRLRWNYLGRIHDLFGEANQAVQCFVEAQRGLPMQIPMLAELPAELDQFLSKPMQAESIPDPLPNAPVFLLGAPGSGVERVAALLADQSSFAMLTDRVGVLQRDDDFAQPDFALYLAGISEEDAMVRRERYFAGIRQLGVPEDHRVVDWLPRWDARLLAFIQQVLPDARFIIVNNDIRDALLNWLVFGWAPGFPCADIMGVAAWMTRAQKHLSQHGGMPRLTINADAVLADLPGVGAELARFIGLDALVSNQNLPVTERGLGGLPVRFEPGHWRAYRDALAQPYALLSTLDVEEGGNETHQ